MKWNQIGISSANATAATMMLVSDSMLHMLFAEFVQNGIEHNATTVTITSETVNGVQKAVIRNDGDGMPEGEMIKRLCDLFSSSKVTAINENRGMGARVTGLKASPAGLIYRSCHRGLVHEIILRWHDSHGLQWSEPRHVKKYPKEQLAYDWVETVFIGESLGHDTIKRPYDGATHSLSTQAGKDILRSIWRLPAGFSIKCDVGSDRYSNAVLTAFDGLEKYDAIDSILSDGILFHFIDLEKITEDGRKSPRFSSLGVLGGVPVPTGVIFKNRIFDVHKDFTSWKRLAQRIGLDLVAGTVMVAIELPSDFPVAPDLNRTQLKWTKTMPQYRAGRSDVIEIVDFADQITAAIPGWVQERIEKERKKFSSCDAANDAFVNLMREYQVMSSQLTQGSGDDRGEETDTVTGGEGSTDTPISELGKKRLKDGGNLNAKKKKMPRTMPLVAFHYDRDQSFDIYFSNGNHTKPLNIIHSTQETGQDTFHVNMASPVLHAIYKKFTSECSCDPFRAEKIVEAVIKEKVIAPYAVSFYIHCDRAGIFNDIRRFADVANNHDSHLGMLGIYFCKVNEVDKEIETRMRKLGFISDAA